MAQGSLAYGFRGTHVLAIVVLGLAAVARALPPPRQTLVATWLLRSERATLPLAAIWLTSSAFGADAQLVFPLGLLVLAGAAAVLERPAALFAASTAAVFAVAQWVGFGSWRGDLRELVAEILYIVALTAAGGWWVRPALERAAGVDVGKAKVAGDAVALGLTDAALAARASPEPGVEARLESLGGSVSQLLRLGRAAVDGHTAVFLVRHDDGAFRAFRAEGKDQELVIGDPIPAETGALGALVRAQREPNPPPALRVEVKPDGPGLPYYRHTPARIRHAMFVPLRGADGSIDALLVVDRTVGDAFDDAAMARAVELATLMARALELERHALGAAARISAQEAVLDVVRGLAIAHDPEETYGAVLAGAERLVDLRVGLLCTFDGRSARVAAAVGGDALPLVGTHIPESGSIAALTLRATAPFPTTRTWSPGHGSLIAPHLGPKLVDGEPLLGIPLRHRDRAVGALLLVPHHPLDEETLARLQILATQGAVALHQSEAVSELQRRATIDPLTGIDNRASLLGRLDQSMKRLGRLGLQLAVVQLDLDHFKAINDTHGHAVGDEVLRSVAAILKAKKRESDSVGRMGGEEFVLVLEQADETGAMFVCERIRKAIEALRVPTSHGPIQVTASLGVAIAPDHGERADDLLSRADAALYRAKEAGRNQVRLFKRAAPARSAHDTVEDPPESAD